MLSGRWATLRVGALTPFLIAAGQPAALRAAVPVRPGPIRPAYSKTVEAAVASLPSPLKRFYRAHRREMPSLSREPRYPPRTPERRFLVDRLVSFPFTGLPRSEPELRARFGEQTEGLGRLPWLVHESYDRLVAAMRERDKARILGESDTLAILMVDLHTVVNLTQNYDGQNSGQHGLYVRLVDKLPLALGRDLKLSPHAAVYLDAPKDYVFTMMAETYVWLDNTLYLEALAKRGKQGYGEIYFAALARRVGPILKARLSRAAENAASYWYTAWTAAGRPPLE